MGMAFWGAMKDYDEKALEEALRAMRESSDTTAHEADHKDAKAERDSDVELTSATSTPVKVNPPRS